MIKKRVVLTLIVSLIAEFFNKLSPLLILYLAQARLGTAAFGQAQFALAFMETLIPFVAFGYGTLATIEIGAQKDPLNVGRIMTGVMVLRTLHFVVVS